MNCLKKHRRDLETYVDKEENALMLEKIGHFSECADDDFSAQSQTNMPDLRTNSLLEGEMVQSFKRRKV